MTDTDYLDGDPDLGRLDAGGDPSDLDAIRAEFDAEIVPTVVLPVEDRPGYSVRYRTNFTGRDLDNLRKAAKNKTFSEKLDGVKYGALLLAFTCQGIIRHGQPLEESLGDDKPATFTSRTVQELMGTDDAQSTVRKFYGLEGKLDAAARKLMTEAGWGDDVDANPTE